MTLGFSVFSLGGFLQLIVKRRTDAVQSFLVNLPRPALLGDLIVANQCLVDFASPMSAIDANHLLDFSQREQNDGQMDAACNKRMVNP